MTSAIEVKNLQKKYGENTVLKDISFQVKKGEVFALLGTNGAGKTTTLECIEGLRQFDSGHISVEGKLGVQLQSTSLPANIKAIEALILFSKWNDSKLDKNFIERIGLDKIKDKQYFELSTGQKRKLHLALALVANPDIIILDEPTAGLDVESRVVLHDEIKMLKKKGKTIVIASHDMAEVESLSDRIAILKDGEIVFIGPPDELMMKIKSTYKILLKFSEPFEFGSLSTCSYQRTHQGYTIFLTNSIEEGLLELLTLAKKNKIKVYDLKIEDTSLEQRFMEIAKEVK